MRNHIYCGSAPYSGSNSVSFGNKKFYSYATKIQPSMVLLYPKYAFYDY